MMADDDRQQQDSKAKPLGAALIALLGLAGATALLVQTPAVESGRTVEAVPAPDGKSITVTHKAGPQYLAVYLDIVKVPTACDGLTKGMKLGQRYTEAQCMAMLEAELVDTGQRVLACTPALKAQGRDNQRVAAVLLAYNIGWPRYCHSTADRKFDAGDINGACDAFLMWNRAGGRVVRGLTNRRQHEIRICKTGVPS